MCILMYIYIHVFVYIYAYVTYTYVDMHALSYVDTCQYTYSYSILYATQCCCTTPGCADLLPVCMCWQRGGYNKNKTADAPNCHPVEDLPAASAVDFDTIEELPSECASVDDTGQQHPAHAHVAEQLLLALPAVWNNLQHNSPAGAHLTPKTFRGLLAQEAGVDLSAADECKEAVDSLISVLSDVDFPDSGQEKAVEQQRADDKIPYWIVNQKIKMRCEYTGATLSLPHLFGRSAKTVNGLHTEIERARQAR